MQLVDRNTQIWSIYCIEFTSYSETEFGKFSVDFTDRFVSDGLLLGFSFLGFNLPEFLGLNLSLLFKRGD